jgi:surface antigen
MVGRYPNWGGDAFVWDDNAAATGWAVRSWPRPDSIAVWQQASHGGVGSLGHVGYVNDTRVSRGVLQMSISDRNWDNAGGDRTKVWVPFTKGMKFIVAPPRFG